MNLDSGQIKQLLGSMQFPIGKNNLVQMARQLGANDQIVSLLQRLPDKTYNSAQDLQKDLEKQGNIGGLKS